VVGLILKRLKIAIAGAGGQGKTHICNCLRLKDIELVAIADSSKFALSRLSHLNLKLYADYGEMFRKEELDAVIIALPTHLHKDCVVLAAENGVNVFIEKPLARNAGEGREIEHAVNGSGIHLMLGMCQRFEKGCRKLKEDIDAGTLGRIDFASGLFFTGPFAETSRVSEWLFNPPEVRGALLDSGCHLVDLFVWYFGDVASVLGHRESLLNLGYDDYADVMMRFKNGVNAIAIVSWRTHVRSYRIEVAGESGRRVVLNKALGPLDIGLSRAAASFVKENALRMVRGGPFLPLGEEFYLELEYFVRCLKMNNLPEPSVSDGLKVLEIMDAVYAAELHEV
jgi:predicted dehydrogenase